MSMAYFGQIGPTIPVSDLYGPQFQRYPIGQEVNAVSPAQSNVYQPSVIVGQGHVLGFMLGMLFFLIVVRVLYEAAEQS